VHTLFPRLWAARGAQEIRLRELSRRASERLVRLALGPAISPPTLASLLDRAHGHAFYLEELIRAVAAGRGDELPETVLAMVQARLERLDSEVRRVLRAASVFGDVFWKAGVEALLGATGSSVWLDELHEQEVISVVGEGRFPAQIEYCFRHSLVREAAYGMLTEPDRVLGHRLAGEWLEQVGETDPMALGEHFERGAVPDRAVAWFRRAAEQALEGGDLEAVTLGTGRALACNATGATRGALLTMQGYIHTWRTNYGAAAACYRDALPELSPSLVHWYSAIGGALYAAVSLGHDARVAELIDALRAGLRESGDKVPPVQGMSAAVPVLCVVGEYDLARAFIERFTPLPEDGDGSSVNAAIDVARCHEAFFTGRGGPWALLVHARAALARGERDDEPRTIHMAQAYEGTALVKLGAAERGEQRMRDARKGAVARGLHLTGQFVDLFMVESLTRRMALDEAEELLRECLQQSQPNALWNTVSAVYWGRIMWRRGNFDGARTVLRSVVDVLGPLSPGYAALANGVLSRVQQLTGAVDDAMSLAHQSLAHLDAVGTWYNDVIIRVRIAEIRHALGDHAGARRALDAGLAQIHSRAAMIEDAELRTSYLTCVPENVMAATFDREWRK
jgi:ATP/maltotriose-dependent transcriptional regulator MalT